MTQQPIDTAQLEAILSRELGKTVSITTVEPAGKGFHSEGFRIVLTTGESFFLKKISTKRSGFEIPERRLSSLLVSDGMARRAEHGPRSLGVIVANGDQGTLLPQITEDTALYHLQEYEALGENHWSELRNRVEKKWVDDADRKEIESIVSYLARLHTTTHPSSDKKHHADVYNASLRNALTHPELGITLLHDFNETHPLLPPSKQGSYVSSLWRLAHEWKGDGTRLRALHGDFWGGNLFFRSDGSPAVIDYSRVPWGEPGIDVAHWLSQYLRLYHETNNPYFRELGETFLTEYEKTTGDTMIRKYLALELGLMGIIYASFDMSPDLDMERHFFATIQKILETGTFTWDV